MADKPEVITTEVEASEETVKAVRAEIPVGQGGTPIDRLPLNPQLVLMANSGIYSKRIASTDRCIRVVEVPQKGGGTLQFHCSRACVGVGDMKLCPEHDKAAFSPNQTPVARGRVINSASIELSAGEQAEVAKISKSFGSLDVPRVTPPAPAVRPEGVVPTPPVARAEDKTGPEPPHDVKVYFTLDELSSRDVLEAIKAKICDALDGLPCRNVREMKQIVALQEKVAKISKGGKRHGRASEGPDSTEG